MDTIASLTNTLLLHLVWTSIQATLLIGLLWLLGRALPRLPTPTRCLLWWLLGVQLLIGLAWQTPITLPLLPAQISVASATTPQVIHVDAQKTPVASSIASTPTDTSQTSDAPSWREGLVALWLCGLLAQLALVARQWQRTRRIRRQSKPLDDSRLYSSCAEQAQRLGLRHRPQLRVSDAIDSPQVTGLWRPVILLPARSALTHTEQTMALAHELAHICRGDLWLGWIPALAKGLFFFHPLVRLAMREYTLHREAACDSQALRLQETPCHAYGQLLLRLGVERSEAMGLVGVASPSLQQLKRRLAMLQHAAHATPRARDWLVVALIALACIIPYHVVQADGGTQVMRRAVQTSVDADIVPMSPLPAPPYTVEASGAGSSTPACGVGADNIRFCGATFLWYARPAKSGQSVVFFDKRHVIIHGTHADVVAASRYYNPGASALWFRRGDKAWVTRDVHTIDRAWRIYEPALERMRQRDRLTDEQGVLTDKQSTIASQLAGFARKLASLARQQADLARKRVTLAQRQASIAQQEYVSRQETGGATDKTSGGDIDAERNAMQAQRHALDVQQHALDAQHARLARQRAQLEAKLNPQRQALAVQRSKLVKQQNALAAHRKQAQQEGREAMQHLLDEVLAKGLATPVRRD